MSRETYEVCRSRLICQGGPIDSYFANIRRVIAFATITDDVTVEPENYMNFPA